MNTLQAERRPERRARQSKGDKSDNRRTAFPDNFGVDRKKPKLPKGLFVCVVCLLVGWFFRISSSSFVGDGLFLCCCLVAWLAL